MGSSYILSLQPTFTQGFILGQVSILALFAVILKYLFLDTEPSSKASERDPPVSQPTRPSTRLHENHIHAEAESTEWLNALLHQVCRRYRPVSEPLCANYAFATSGCGRLSLQVEGRLSGCSRRRGSASAC